jgi:two-component system sensor histidine kinase SenX3
LGLAIVKHVAANHGGSIRLWSREGEGSTFTLRLPLAEPATEPPPEPAPGPPAEPPAERSSEPPMGPAAPDEVPHLPEAV